MVLPLGVFALPGGRSTLWWHRLDVVIGLGGQIFPLSSHLPGHPGHYQYAPSITPSPYHPLHQTRPPIESHQMSLNALLSKLKLIDQRKATAPTYNEFDFSAAFDTLPVPANTSGSSILESSTPLLAIYFGAQWCPPCRAFSPKLSQFAKDNASQISVILCSADHSHVQAQQFARGKSFLVIPWTSTARSELQSYFKITSFPTLIVLDTRKQSCQVITRR